MRLALLLLACAGCAHKPVAPAATAPAIRPTITIHVQKAAAQRALDEGTLIDLLEQDFRNMDMGADHVDLKIRRQMDAVMKRLMTKNQWVEP